MEDVVTEAESPASELLGGWLLRTSCGQEWGLLEAMCVVRSPSPPHRLPLPAHPRDSVGRLKAKRETVYTDTSVVSGLISG